MAEHIRRFNSLRVEVDFHRPVGVARKSNVDIHLIFPGTLDESWNNLYQQYTALVTQVLGVQTFAEGKVGRIETVRLV